MEPIFCIFGVIFIIAIAWIFMFLWAALITSARADDYRIHMPDGSVITHDRYSQ